MNKTMKKYVFGACSLALAALVGCGAATPAINADGYTYQKESEEMVLFKSSNEALDFFLNDYTKRHSGWVEEDSVRFYRDFHADPWSGWLTLEEGTYYLHEDGTPTTGWQTVDGTTYYFGQTGLMHTGWLEEDGKLYYMGFCTSDIKLHSSHQNFHNNLHSAACCGINLIKSIFIS